MRDSQTELGPVDALLTGTDLMKPLISLFATYDDTIGATAAFNLNLLARVNRELGGNFHLSVFEHVARFSAGARSVEMRLRAKERVEARVDAANVAARPPRTRASPLCRNRSKKMETSGEPRSS
ncbi:L-histidine N(alpha)-methyltransferase [Paraburkholderia translucens]|uniref:L-histidine N(alpha)-methyltransferase n=1 Tax=Paraburkholderia translucens TaxID=2886945 RepID=UPI001E6353AF|nr:L-histidine N(alpha)-methyltransferase [Paraburkholderia sp. MMS20-SJTN17]